jgi:hypothetical protein
MRMLIGILVVTVCSLSGCSIDRFLPDPVAADAGPPLDDTGISTPFVDASDDAAEPTRDSGGRVDVPLLDVNRAEAGPDARPPGTDTAGADSGPVVPDISTEDPPVVSFVYPDRGSVRGGDLVVLDGANFTFDTEVLVGGRAGTGIDVIDANQLAFFTPVGDEGPATIKVISGGGAVSLEDAFTYEAALRIERVSPDTGPTTGGLPVEVTGAGFTDSTIFIVGDRDARDVTVLNSQRATMVVPPAAVGTRSVDVIAIDSDIARLDDGFTYQDAPRLQALMPPAGPIAGGTVIRVDGEGLVETCSIQFGSFGRAPLVRAPEGWFEVVSPRGSGGPTGVSLDCGARGADYLNDAFTWLDPSERQLAGIVPASGFTAGGQVVTLYGAGFEADPVVELGGQSASVLFAAVDRIDVLTPAAGAGLVDLLLEDGAGTLELPDAYRYIERPRFDAVSPASGPIEGGWAVELSGAGLDSVEQLLLDGVPLTLTGATASSLRFTAPAGAGGAASIDAKVAGIRYSTGLTLQYVGERAFVRFSPSTAPIGGGTPIAVVGSGFDRSCQLTIDGQALATELFGSRSLIARVPAHAAGTAQVGVAGCGDPYVFDAPLRYIDPSLGDGGTTGDAINGRMFVSVLDARTGGPIEGATVMVQVRDSSPYVALTDERGQVVFVGDDLVGPQTVTAFAEQRSTESFVGVNAERVTLLLSPLPPPPCPPEDPECQPPVPDALSSVVGFLTGLDKLIDPPPGAEVVAIVDTTRLARGYINPAPGDNELYENGPFVIQTRNGDLALIALCGYRYTATNEFVPLRMGVVRGLAQRPGSEARVTIECNMELNNALTVKLRAAPALLGPDEDPYTFPGSYRAKVAIDFGGEGYFESLPITQSTLSTIDVTNLPPLTGPLADLSFDITGGTYPRIGNFPSAESYSFGVRRYGVITMPPLLAIPEFTYPTPAQNGLTDGYVEWTLDPAFAEPDFFYISANSPDEGFLRWSLFVPGSYRSFHFADFPAFTEEFGPIPSPGEPVTALGLSVRSVDVDTFDFDDFRRSALSFRNWRASSITYGNFVLQQPDPVPDATP